MPVFDINVWTYDPNTILNEYSRVNFGGVIYDIKDQPEYISVEDNTVHINRNRDSGVALFLGFFPPGTYTISYSTDTGGPSYIRLADPNDYANPTNLKALSTSDVGNISHTVTTAKEGALYLHAYIPFANGNVRTYNLTNLNVSNNAGGALDMSIIARDQITLTDLTDISLTRPYYILVSNTSAAPSKPTTYPPPTGWVTSEPSYDSSKTAYMSWYTEYSNGLFDYSDVSKVSSYEAAKEAWNKANNAQNAINNLEIGGRNLLVKNDWYTAGNYNQSRMTITGPTEDSTTLSGYSFKFTVTDATTNTKHVYLTNMKSRGGMVDGEEYIASFWIRASKDTNIQPNAHIECYKTAQTKIENPVITTKWQRCSNKFIFNASAQYQAWYLLYPNALSGFTTSDYIEICDLKLERGNIATAWTPAPEDVEASSVEYVIGTGTSAGLWKGKTNKTSLYEGMQIGYWINIAGGSLKANNTTVAANIKGGVPNTVNGFAGTWLNLTLSDGTETGWYPCFYGGTTRLTTHYGVNNSIRLTFKQNISVTISGVGTYTVSGWWADAQYYSNTYDRTFYSNQVKAETAITAAHIICGTSAGYKNAAAGVSFDLSYPILYSPNAIAADTSRTDTYIIMPSVNIRTSYGADIPGFAVNKKVYLKGTIVANTFTIADTGWITATEPSSEDSYYYIPLGSFANNATASNAIIYFMSSSALYKFYDGSFQPISSSSAVTSKALTDSINGLSNSFAEDLAEQRDEFNEVLTGYATNKSVADQIKTVSDELENWKKRYGEDQIEYSATFQRTDEDISIITNAENRATLQEILTKFQFRGPVLYIVTDDNGIHSEQGSDFYQYVKGGTVILKIDPSGIKATEASISGAINIGSGDVSAFSDQWAIRRGAKNGSGQYDLDFVWIGG